MVDTEDCLLTESGFLHLGTVNIVLGSVLCIEDDVQYPWTSPARFQKYYDSLLLRDKQKCLHACVLELGEGNLPG